MSPFEAIALGLIQGLTEFLPVSSSGHLVIAQTLLGVPSPGVFVEVALHLATLLSVVVVYRAKLVSLLRGLFGKEREAIRYAALLVVATIPAGVVGLFFEEQIERLFDTPVVTGVMLIVTGFLLYSTKLALRERPADTVGTGTAIAMGFAQAFAILPGISRSGATITAGMWGGVSGVAAAEFSFLMSIPAIAGAAVLQVPHMSQSVAGVGAGALVAGFVAALISGILAIRSLIWLLRRQGFHAFALYVWAAGAAFLLYLWLRP